jgi:hypothetical protein
MKAISASIVVLAGAILLAVGGTIPHGDTSTFVMLVGGIVGVAGLAGWIMEMLMRDK